MSRSLRGATAYRSGALAEEAVARHYEERGATVAQRRWRGPFGEIDLIVREGARVVVVDGSHTLFDEAAADSRAVRRPAGGAPRTTSLANTGALQAIPDFRALVAEAIKDAVAQGVKGQFAPIDIGVICDVAAVRVVGRRLYERVFAKLAQTQQRPPHP